MLIEMIIFINPRFVTFRITNKIFTTKFAPLYINLLWFRIIICPKYHSINNIYTCNFSIWMKIKYSIRMERYFFTFPIYRFTVIIVVYIIVKSYIRINTTAILTPSYFFNIYIFFNIRYTR